MLQKGWGSIKQAYVNLEKACFQLGYTPEIWRHSSGIILPKPWERWLLQPQVLPDYYFGPGALKWIERVIPSTCIPLFCSTASYRHGSKELFKAQQEATRLQARLLTIAATHKLVIGNLRQPYSTRVWLWARFLTLKVHLITSLSVLLREPCLITAALMVSTSWSCHDCRNPQTAQTKPAPNSKQTPTRLRIAQHTEI